MNAPRPPNPISKRAHALLLTLWFVITAGSIALFIGGITPQYLKEVWAAAMMYPSNLEGLGVSIPFYAGFQTALDVISATVFIAVGLLIFIRGWKDWKLILVSLTMTTFGMLFVSTLSILVETYPIWTIPASIIRAFGLGLSLPVPFYLVPDGRYIPKITKWLTVLWLAMTAAWAIFPQLPANLIHATTWDDNLGLSFGLLGIFFVSGVAAQIYRYRKISGPVEKQQTKWIVLGTTAAVVGFILFNTPMAVIPELKRPGFPHLMYTFLAEPVYMVVTALVPVSIAISMLKYRLWDVDRIINRSLVYGILTLILGGVYIALVLMLRTSLLGFTGNSSTITIILSTLAVAALFTPVRNFLQGWIDRQFFRKKYDSQRILELFRQSLGTRVDISSISHELIAVVDQTIQPESVSLWLAKRGDDDDPAQAAASKAGR